MKYILLVLCLFCIMVVGAGCGSSDNCNTFVYEGIISEINYGYDNLGKGTTFIIFNDGKWLCNSIGISAKSKWGNWVRTSDIKSGDKYKIFSCTNGSYFLLSSERQEVIERCSECK